MSVHQKRFSHSYMESFDRWDKHSTNGQRAQRFTYATSSTSMISSWLARTVKWWNQLPFSNYVNSGFSFAGQRTFTTGSGQVKDQDSLVNQV